MSSKLFAFNVSKKLEKVDRQWVGDLIARASVYGYCTGDQNYGQETCLLNNGQCTAYGLSGYHICDGSNPD